MKLLASKFGALAILGIALGAVSVVLFAAGSLRWGAAVLALAVLFLFAMLLLSHAFAVRTAARAREVQQRDTRTLNQGIVTATKAASLTAQTVKELTDASTGVAGGAQSSQQTAERTAAPESQELPAASTGNSFGSAGPYFGIGADFEYGDRARRAPGHFETFALRAKSTKMRDAFARSATNLQFDYAEMIRIVRALRAGKAPGAGAVVTSWSSKGVLAIARVVANQRLAPSDSGEAVLLFRLVKDVFGVDKLGRSDAYVFAEALALEGQHKEAARVFKETRLARRDPMQAKLMELNAIHKRGLEKPENRSRWADTLNAIYASEELAPVSFREPLGPTLLDSLSCETEARIVEGPSVSVLVPSFNGSDHIITTLDSLVYQTWKNLEVIVVDDFSALEHRERLEEICSRYEDVTLLLQPENLGAYMARKRALEVASGEFITVHDDDDWSHPQKLEIQFKHLLENPEQAANMSRHARAGEDLLLTRINNNPSFSQANFSSLLTRRAMVDQLGGWDTVNRGADAEFRDRLVKLTEQPVEIVGTAPLSFTRTHDASLTSGEIGRGYIDPARLFYQSAYFRSLHAAEIVEGAIHQKDFPRPLNMKPGMRGKHLGTFDVAFATDFRFPGGTTSLTTNEIEFAAQLGLRVGMIQLDSPLNSPKDSIAVRALEVAQHENVNVLSLNDQADIHLLVVRHPTVLQFAESLTAKLSVGHLVVVVNNPPILAGGTGVVFELETVKDNASRIFGVTPDIAPESEVTRHLALTMVHPSLLADYDWPGFIDTEKFRSAGADRTRGEVPVLGRHSRDALLKWPEKRGTTLAVYQGSDDLEVKILGGVRSQPQALQEELRASAEVIEFGDKDSEEFLKELDFWAYYHSSALTESFGMSTVEAMATGLVVFVPRYMRPNFDDGAVYVEPKQVRAKIREYWQNPELLRAQGERAREVVMERYSATAFEQRLMSLLEQGRAILQESDAE